MQPDQEEDLLARSVNTLKGYKCEQSQPLHAAHWHTTASIDTMSVTVRALNAAQLEQRAGGGTFKGRYKASNLESTAGTSCVCMPQHVSDHEAHSHAILQTGSHWRRSRRARPSIPELKVGARNRVW